MEELIGSIVARTVVLVNEVTNIWIQYEQPNLGHYVYAPGNITITDCGHQLGKYIIFILYSLYNLVLPYVFEGVSGGGLAATQM